MNELGQAKSNGYHQSSIGSNCRAPHQMMLYYTNQHRSHTIVSMVMVMVNEYRNTSATHNRSIWGLVNVNDEFVNMNTKKFCRIWICSK
jgi:hypothetical protein